MTVSLHYARCEKWRNMAKKFKPHHMESLRPMPTYWDVYRIQPGYIKHAEFVAYRYYPGMPASSGPIQVFVGSFLAMTDAEAVAKAKLQHDGAAAA